MTLRSPIQRYDLATSASYGPVALIVQKDAGRYVLYADHLSSLEAEVATVTAERDALHKLLNTPEFHDFLKGVPLEAAHQVQRWGSEHDAGKSCLDWFWLIGYLAQRIVEYDKAGNRDKALHHCVTTAAALMNWHSALEHRYNGKPYPMVPGHAPSVARESALTGSTTQGETDER